MKIEYDEIALVRGAVGGNREDFGVLYSHFRPLILFWVFKKVGDRDVAEDITEEVFSRALKNIASYVGRGCSFSSWLYQIAHNHVINYYRDRKQHDNVDDANIAVQLSTRFEPEDQIDLTRNCRRVDLAMRALGSAQRQVLVKRFFENRSIIETASALGRSASAVRALQHRAIGVLRKELRRDLLLRSHRIY